MPIVLKLIISALIGYTLGTINPAFIYSKLKGTDIRKLGSGNAGASNAVIVFGKAIGAFSAIFDIAKATVSVKLCDYLFDEPGVVGVCGALAGASCIMGHIFPILMGFRGGKGLACLGGVVLALGWKPFVVLLGIELVLLLSFNYICVVSVSAAVFFPVYFFIVTGNPIGAAIYIIPAVAMFIKHIKNWKRIMYGVEARFSGLWEREEEEKRVNYNKDFYGIETLQTKVKRDSELTES